MSASLLAQIKQRRLQLGLKQQDMYLRTGISRQQYQHLESQGNPRLNTLELVAQGLESQLMLIPKDKVAAVQRLLADTPVTIETSPTDQELVDNPWLGILED